MTELAAALHRIRTALVEEATPLPGQHRIYGRPHAHPRTRWEPRYSRTGERLPGAVRIRPDCPRPVKGRCECPEDGSWRPATGVIRADATARYFIYPSAAASLATAARGAPIHGTNVLPPFRRALAAAGLPRVTLHDLRHSCATVMLSAGIPLPVIAEMLGHSSIRVTADLYAHIVPSLRQDAADKLAAALR